MRSATVQVLLPEEQVKNNPSIGLLILEVLGWSLAYSVFQWTAVPFFRGMIQNSKIGHSSATKEGQLLKSLVGEATLAFSLSVHHILSAGMMLAGYAQRNPSLWLHGVAVEMGYEVVDTLAILTDSWPYSDLKTRSFKIVPLLHHVPTLLLIPMLVRIGFHENPDVQKIGWSLIGAGGIGYLAEGLKKSIYKADHPWLWLIIHLLNAAVLFACRMVIFPIASINGLKTLQEDYRGKYLYPVCVLGLSSLMLFNMSIMTIYAWKSAGAIADVLVTKSKRDFKAEYPDKGRVKQA